MKRQGWSGESYRHYLAAKGVKTTYLARRSISGEFFRNQDIALAERSSPEHATHLRIRAKKAEQAAATPLIAEEQREAELLNLQLYRSGAEQLRVDERKFLNHIEDDLGISKGAFSHVGNAAADMYLREQIKNNINKMTPEQKENTLRDVDEYLASENLAKLSGGRVAERIAFAKLIRSRLGGETELDVLVRKNKVKNAQKLSLEQKRKRIEDARLKRLDRRLKNELAAEDAAKNMSEGSIPDVVLFDSSETEGR
jgi:hypothetical protein